MPQYGFGAGSMWGVSTAAVPTPVQFGALQNVGINFSSTVKTLFGGSQLPLTQARGTMNVTGKATHAQFKGRVLSDLFFNDAMVTGQTIASDNESATIPVSTTFTVQGANHSTAVRDLGVRYTATGIPLVNVSSLTALGQYTYATGVYTFDSLDGGAKVNISYEYTTTGGDSLTLVNQPIGSAPNFVMVLSLLYNTQYFNMTLNSCVANKTSFTTALEDFTKQDFEFAAFVDATGTLGTISVAEVS